MAVPMRWSAVLVSMVVAGCAGEAPDPGSGNGEELDPRTPAPARFVPAAGLVSGSLALEGDTLRFRPCGASEVRSLEDDPEGEARTLLRDLAPREGTPVTVLLRLDGDRIVELRYGGLEGPSCNMLPPEGLLEARGNEPFWLVSLLDDRIRIVTPDLPDGVEYHDLRWTPPSDEGWTVTAEREHADGVEFLTLTFQERRCIDSMSGARYPFTASLTSGVVAGEGCALGGRGR